MGTIRTVPDKEKPTTPPMIPPPPPPPPPPNETTTRGEPPPKKKCGQCIQDNLAGQVSSRGPRYSIYLPWFSRIIGKGCARCGGRPPGWVQRQMTTPYRFKRFVLWSVNLVPRMCSLIGVVMSRKASFAQQAERHAKCERCPGVSSQESWTPGLVKELRLVRGRMTETSFCNICDCPRWRMPRWIRWLWDIGSHLDYKNSKKGHRCPLGLHEGSSYERIYLEYIQKVLPAVDNTPEQKQTNQSTSHA